MIRPTIALTSGATLRVLGLDAGRATALAQNFEAALSPENLIKIVDDAIELGVPMWVECVRTNNSSHWTTVRNHAVVSVNCQPFD